MTNGQINRLGEKIRKEGKTLSEDILNELQQYRTSYKEPLSQVFNILCSLSRIVYGRSIVTYRIKRFESIINKLDRYPEMDFSRMWDIGGCRCILRNNHEVFKLKAYIEEKLNVVKVYDYITNPQPEGYKAIHLFVRISDSNKTIEVQLRNQTDHNWATLVEITDLLFDAKLKEYGENKDLLRFHLLLSNINKIDVNQKKEIAELIGKYNYFHRLSEVFARNYIQVRTQWYNIEAKINDKFFLIETKKDEVPKIYSFENFYEAEQVYFSLYKSNENANIVLTHLTSQNYNQISIAYSNYILTFHTFLEDCYDILENLVINSLENKNYFSFYKFFNLYNSLVYNHIKNLISEIKEINELTDRKSKNYKIKNRKKESEWASDIQSQINKNKARTSKLSRVFRKNIQETNSINRFFFIKIIRHIEKKYTYKLKKQIEILYEIAP